MTMTEDRMDIYEFEKSRFAELLETDETYAYKRYGLTLLYSLEPEETFSLRHTMGWDGNDALDLYNKGTIEAQNDRLTEAMNFYKEAEKLGCDQPELFFNMAVILEENENIKDAVSYYQKYIDASEKWDEIPKGLQAELDEARAHIKDLKGERNTDEEIDE
jgi:tetratricopeptide (TPR) repeat protein